MLYSKGSVTTREKHNTQLRTRRIRAIIRPHNSSVNDREDVTAPAVARTDEVEHLRMRVAQGERTAITISKTEKRVRFEYLRVVSFSLWYFTLLQQFFVLVRIAEEYQIHPFAEK